MFHPIWINFSFCPIARCFQRAEWTMRDCLWKYLFSRYFRFLLPSLVRFWMFFFFQLLCALDAHNGQRNLTDNYFCILSAPSHSTPISFVFVLHFHFVFSSILSLALYIWSTRISTLSPSSRCRVPHVRNTTTTIVITPWPLRANGANSPSLPRQTGSNRSPRTVVL